MHCVIGYNHDCYEITDKVLELLQTLDVKEICESDEGRVYLEEINEDYPGCGNCSCCQRKGENRNIIYIKIVDWVTSLDHILVQLWRNTCSLFNYSLIHFLDQLVHCDEKKQRNNGWPMTWLELTIQGLLVRRTHHSHKPLFWLLNTQKNVSFLTNGAYTCTIFTESSNWRLAHLFFSRGAWWHIYFIS